MKSFFEECLKSLELHLQTLPDKPEETAESTLKALWMTASGSPVSAERAVAAELSDLTQEQTDHLNEMIRRRLEGVPLGHLSGRQMFMGIEFIVSPDALLPRRETEILARGAIEIVSGLIGRQGKTLLVDTCCGSGNVTLAVAHRVPEVRAIGVDLSEEAVELARSNACVMNLDNRVEFRAGDLLEPVRDLFGQVDVLTCNPPYISSAKVQEMDQEISGHEPQLAFDGGPFGIRILNRLLKETPQLLRAGGYLAFEVGLGQGEAMAVRLEKSGKFRSIQLLKDESENTRAISAQRI